MIDMESTNGHAERLVALGERLAQARRRRKLRQQDLAERAGCSRSTVQALERGSPTCSIGNLLSVLWVLGLSENLDFIANPLLEEQGLALDLTSGVTRVRLRTKVDNDF
jgi:transcriptional regulator with XRE-family HTH domain